MRRKDKINNMRKTNLLFEQRSLKENSMYEGSEEDLNVSDHNFEVPDAIGEERHYVTDKIIKVDTGNDIKAGKPYTKVYIDLNQYKGKEKGKVASRLIYTTDGKLLFQDLVAKKLVDVSQNPRLTNLLDTLNNNYQK